MLRRSLALLAVVATISAALTPSVASDDGVISFTVINQDKFSWTARVSSTLYRHPYNVVYVDDDTDTPIPRVALPHSLVMFGGDDGVNAADNDVWLMQTPEEHRLLDFTLIAGNRSAAPYNASSFIATVNSVSAVIQPPYPAYDTNITITCVMVSGVRFDGSDTQTPAVYRTNNATQWEQVPLMSPPPPLLHSALVLNTAQTIFMIGGQTPSSAGARAVSDVWSSPNRGHDWTLVTVAPFSGRFAHSVVKMTGNGTSSVGGSDVIIVAGGMNGVTLYNDVWASSDDCLTWIQLTGSSQWSPRRDFTLMVLYESNVLLLLGGRDAAQSYDSIFASFNGGYTWVDYDGVSSHTAGGRGHRGDRFRAGHNMMATTDKFGHLLIGGGRDEYNNILTEIFRSNQIVDSLDLLTAAFDARISDCGIGLYCFDSSTTFMQGDRVYCSACAPQHIDNVAFLVIIIVLVLAFIAFIVWRNCGHKWQQAKSPLFSVDSQESLNFSLGHGHADPWSEHLINEDEANE